MRLVDGDALYKCRKERRMRLVDGDALYKQLQDDEELARKRVLDTESALPYSNNINPAYTRYLAQMDERTRLKNMVADAPTIEQDVPERNVGKWIPCSERLPEWYWIEIGGTEKAWDGERVIVCGKTTEWPYTGMACGLYGPNGWLIEDDAFCIDDEPIAWMPLPEPYQPKEE